MPCVPPAPPGAPPPKRGKPTVVPPLVAYCGAQMLLAELEQRNIRLHEKVTENIVTQRYKFGKLLGQGASATVYEAKHKKTGRTVAIKVIKKDDDMNDDESMATELEILKSVHHRYADVAPALR